MKASLRLISTLLLGSFTSLMLLLPTAANAAELEAIGTFDFPTSGSPEAQQHFVLGVGYLHSFGWKQALDEFRKAQELEPDFAMAYWGEVFTYNHPLIGEMDMTGPQETLLRLGPTPEIRLAKAPTDREKGFLRAAQAYAFTEGDTGDRRSAWMDSMGELFEQYPDDREVTAFYAVSLLSGATAAGENRARVNMLAGSLALELFRNNADHPGAAHYTIHAFDDPVHAPLALVAAKKYADIAPAVAHARHMPTHIFIQHGMWQEVSDWNENAFNAAADLWQAGDRPGDQNHSSDWGQYGDLQMADYDRARMWIQRAEQVEKNNPGDNRSASTVRTMKSRLIIESEQWQAHPLTAELNAQELLAIGLSAAHLGKLDLARQTADRLAEMVTANPNNLILQISQLEVAGLTKLKQGHSEAAIELLAKGVELTSGMRLPNGAANPLKPVHELTGEVLLAAGKPAQAAAFFEQSLLRTPNRSLSLLGLARAYAASNNPQQAQAMYENLLTVWTDDSMPAVKEAKAYLANQG